MPNNHANTAYTAEELAIKVRGKYQIFGLRLLLISEHFKDSFAKGDAIATTHGDQSNGWLVTLLSGEGGYGLSPAFVTNIQPADIKTFLTNDAATINSLFNNVLHNLQTEYVGPECKGKQLTAINQMFVGAESAALAAKMDAQGL